MRIAVLSDIHGNLLALEAAVRDLRNCAPDAVVNLGDHVSGPLWAAESADLLMSQTSCLQIRGNHDARVVELEPDSLGLSDAAAAQAISSRRRVWLGSLLHTRAADGVLLCHGTPDSDSEYLLEDVSGGFARVAATAGIRRRLGPVAGLVLCGHSHTPGFVRLDDRTWIANPGSVGLQAYEDPGHRHPHVIETGSPHARYLLLDSAGSNWNATFRAVA